jgi:hypothetical protein
MAGETRCMHSSQNNYQVIAGTNSTKKSHFFSKIKQIQAIIIIIIIINSHKCFIRPFIGSLIEGGFFFFLSFMCPKPKSIPSCVQYVTLQIKIQIMKKSSNMPA